MVSTGTEVKEVLTAGPNTKVEFPVNPKMLFCDTNSTSSVLNARTGILKPSLRTSVRNNYSILSKMIKDP